MASGFQSSGFGTGLLSGINQQYAMQRINQEKGDEAQYAAFEEASREYDRSKAKASDQEKQIDAMANILSNGKPNPAAYATARDAVEMGYTGQEHLPYVQDAYQRTIDDMKNDPEKWTGNKQSPASSSDQQEPEDTNPEQTRAIRKFGNQTPLSDLENIRQHNVPLGHSDLPGANWGDPMQAANAQARNKAMMEANVKSDVASQKEKQQMNDLGLNSGEGGDNEQSIGPSGVQPQQSQAPVSSAMPNAQAGADAGGQPQSVSPLAVNASDLAPPGQAQQQPPQQMASAQQPRDAAFMPPDQSQATPDTSNGISLNAPAPPEQSMPDKTTSVDIATNGLNTPYMDMLEKKNPTAAGMIKQIASGELQISPWMLRDRSDGSKSSWYAMIAAAHKYDPSFDMTDYNSRNSMARSYASGQDHKSIVAIDTAAGHLGLLSEAGKALDTGNYPMLNKIAQAYGVQSGEAPVTTFNAIAHRVAPEIVVAYRPTGGSVEEVMQSTKDFEASLSSSQRQGVLQSTAELLNGKIQGMKNAWDTTMGPNKAGKQFFSPNTMDAMKDMGVDINNKTPYTSMKQLRESGGQQSMPTVHSPEEAMKLPPGTTFKTPDGRVKTVPGAATDQQHQNQLLAPGVE